MSTLIANAGSYVVPLSAIVDQLQGRLTDAEIEALLTAVLGGTPTLVRPGDRITADLINGITAQLANHNLRLAQLEAGSSSTGQLAIFQPLPGATLRVGEMIDIIGVNFGFSESRQRVTFDQTPVSGYAEGSSDFQLRVVVPQLASLGQGRPAVLTVSNGVATVTRGVTVVPPAQPLTGTIDIEAGDPEPSPIAAGGDADFPFLLSPRGLNREAEFVLVAELSGQTWPTSLRNASRALLPEARVTLTPAISTTVYVRVAIPAGSDGQGLSLALTASSGPVSGSSSLVDAVVGQAQEPTDPNLTLTVGNVAPPDVFQNGEIRLAGGAFTNIPVSWADSSPGGPVVYELTLELVPTQPGGNPAAGWSVGFTTPNTGSPSQPAATTAAGASFLQFAVAAAADASSTGRLRLTVRRQGAALAQQILFGLRRLI